MNLFLAMTPAQLMNSIVLARTVFAGEENDLYYSDNLAEYARRLESAHAFCAVYRYELVRDLTDRSNAVKRALVRIKNALDLSKVKKSLPSNPLSYQRVFLSGVSLRNYEFYYAIKSFNRDAQITLYEEGVCEYYYLSRKRFSQELFSRLFFHRYYLADCRELYVYEPDVVECAWKNIALRKIPKFNENPSLLRLLNDVFGLRERDCSIYENKVVFLESCFEREEDEARQRAGLRMLLDSYGTDRVIIKMHPRSPREKYAHDVRTVYSSVPFELIMSNANPDNMILASVMTSVLINAKLMLDREPAVICLNRMDRNTELSAIERVFERVRMTYEKERFFIPRNAEELREVIDRTRQGVMPTD